MKKALVIALSLLLVGFVVLLALMIPRIEKVDQQYSALLISRETGEIKDTTVTVNGEWKSRRIGKAKLEFTGRFQVSDLEYTISDTWETSTDLKKDSDIKSLMGFLTYKSDAGVLEAAVLYANEDRSAFVFSDSDVTVVIPADNEEDARRICEELGVAYPG